MSATGSRMKLRQATAQWQYWLPGSCPMSQQDSAHRTVISRLTGLRTVMRPPQRFCLPAVVLQASRRI